VGNSPFSETQQNGADEVFVATYHDTHDRRLARARIALRRRLRNGTGIWEAQIGDEVVAAAGGPVSLPAQLADRLAAPLRNRDLVEVARLRNGQEDVALLEGQRVVRTYGDLDTALRQTMAPPVEARPRRRAPAAEHVRAYLRAQLSEIERTDPLIRSGDDPEAVHDFRVAVRRTRSVLRTTRALYDEEWLASLRAELRWLGRELAALRDLDVLLAWIRNEKQSDSALVVKLLETDRSRAEKQALTTLASDRYLELLDRLAAAVDAAPLRASDLSLEELAGKEFEKLRRAAAKLGRRPTDAEMHRMRIHAKRARYAAELAEPVVRKRARRFVVSARKLQDVVGAHQDAVVAAERIRGVLERSKSAETAFVAGQLMERSRWRQRAARQELPRAWQRVERRGRKTWA
jgi:CHAD domain-containing protein